MPCPYFPSMRFPTWLGEWCSSVATATQTPVDLSAMLVLSLVGAGLAQKFKVIVRDGWAEPTNLFTVTAQLPGERKSSVFDLVMEPIKKSERLERERMDPIIADAKSELKILEARLNGAEKAAAKSNDPSESEQKMKEAKELAQQVAKFLVPELPKFWVSGDVTPEALGKLMDEQGNRTLIADDEGTFFEICIGRYNERPAIEIVLKGHSGGSSRSERINRDGVEGDNHALSMALTVQPDVLVGLNSSTALKGRGFLARLLFSLPRSIVGSRKIGGATRSEWCSTAIRRIDGENLGTRRNYR